MVYVAYAEASSISGKDMRQEAHDVLEWDNSTLLAWVFNMSPVYVYIPWSMWNKYNSIFHTFSFKKDSTYYLY